MYISEDPRAQATDCSHFQWLGYETLAVQPFDAQPNSPAIVSVTLLALRNHPIVAEEATDLPGGKFLLGAPALGPGRQPPVLAGGSS